MDLLLLPPRALFWNERAADLDRVDIYMRGHKHRKLKQQNKSLPPFFFFLNVLIYITSPVQQVQGSRSRPGSDERRGGGSGGGGGSLVAQQSAFALLSSHDDEKEKKKKKKDSKV